MYRALALVLAFTVSAAVQAAPRTFAYDTDGMILVDGKRTFIIGSYYPGPGHAKASVENYRELAGAGFNLVSGGVGTLDMAQQAGLMVWAGVGTVDLANEAESREKLAANVNAIKDHPALAFYEQSDEPAWTWIGTPGADPAAPRVTAAQFEAAYKVIKAADPNHLIYTNHAPTNLVSTLKPYNAGTDIVAVDIYPVNPGGIKFDFALFPDGHQGDFNNTYLSQVGEYVDKMREVAGPSRPVFMVLQGFAWEMLFPQEQRREEKILYPSLAEGRFMAFQSLIKGANGIVYWGTAYTPAESQAWGDQKRVVREVADLAPILVAPAPRLASSTVYHEIGYGVDEGIQYTVRAFEGKHYLFTCNADKHPNKATLGGLEGFTQCRVLNEDRESDAVVIEAGAITDTWKRFDVHLYELSK